MTTADEIMAEAPRPTKNDFEGWSGEHFSR